MENDTITSKQGVLEPVLPDSVTFEKSILAPLRNSYLYEESKECFTYNSACLINNAALQKRYSDFRAEKLANGYSEEELEESFGFLLFNDKSRANRLAETGLNVGQGTCTTLGDCSKGVYISKYSDCLDLKRWYDGKKGYIVLFKLTKGRVKEVTENYTQNFTPPTTGFDCHVSEQLTAVCATTSSFLAFERTQYYMFEHLDGGGVEKYPRHVQPFAIVSFSYGKTSFFLKEKSQENTSFHYQPWRGQLKIGSIVYNIGLRSIHGAVFPTNLPKQVQVHNVIGVSDLRKTLPQAVFETSFLSEVLLDNRWFSLYDVISYETKNDLALLTQELKRKDLALVVRLKDGGLLVLLHVSNFLTYEGSGTEKTYVLQGMFVFPDSRAVPRETKSDHNRNIISSEILQVLPALNYAESEMEKCPLKQQEEPLDILEKHLQDFAALICPGLSSSPSREASMFPDQYDVPAGFPWIASKWTDEAVSRLKAYLKSSQNFEISVTRALELLASGKQQRSDDNDDYVYYYISSPEMAPETSSDVALERDLSNEPEPDLLRSKHVSDDVKNSSEQQSNKEESADTDVSCSVLQKNVGILVPGPAVMSENNPVERTDRSPKLADLPTEHYGNTAEHSNKKSGCASIGESSIRRCLVEVLKKSSVQSASLPLSTEIENRSVSISDTREHSKTEVEKDLAKNIHCLSDARLESGSQITIMDKDISLKGDFPTLISANPTDTIIEHCKNKLPETNMNGNDKKSQSTPMLKRRGKRRKKKTVRRILSTVSEKPTPVHNSGSTDSIQAHFEQSGSETIHLSDDSLKKDWRSLPRRKKHWIANETVKRRLRSDIKTSETESYSKTSDAETNATNLEAVVGEKIKLSTPKRKGFNVRERYGLKTIVTDCGRVFVPHGMEVAAGNMTTSKTKENQDLVTTNSPKESLTNTFPLETDKGDQQTAPTQNISVIKLLSFGHIAEQVPATHTHSDQLLESDLIPTSPEKMKNKSKDSVYKAISISKLKTVLKRAKKTGTGGEPELKKVKPSLTSVHTDTKSSDLLQQHTDSAESLESTIKTSSKILKENGCNIFHKSSFVGQQLITTLIGGRVGGKHCKNDGKNTKEGLARSLSVPSDALNLLADLALSVDSEKTLPNMRAKPRQDERNGNVKISSSPQSQLHDVLPISDILNVPPKSPSPEGLLVTGDLILEISKEHSYSQPNFLWSDLTGAFPQVQPSIKCFQPLLSLSRLYSVKGPDHGSSSAFQENKGKNGWTYPTSLDMPTSTVLKTKERSMFLRSRHIIEKESSIQVTRRWKENYDFRYDSKFTNDKQDKCVTRALHGKWDFSIEDTYEQVHLIFHMWIGLFYSKPTSRFFHFDQYGQPLDKKDPVKVTQGSTHATAPIASGDMSSIEAKHGSSHPGSDALDLSVKTPEAVDCSTKSREENPAPVQSVDLSLDHTMESKEPVIQANLNISSDVQPQVIPMDYRSTLDVLEESSVVDHDFSDRENESTDNDEGSYTKILENNSAYFQLVEKASKMHIDQNKLLKIQKHILSSKDHHTAKALTKRNMVTKASGPKTVYVLHNVSRFPRPVFFSNTSNQLPERENVIKAQLFKYNAGNEASVQMRSSGNVSTFTENNCKNTETESRSERIMPRCVTNDETAMKVKSMLDGTESASDCDKKVSVTDGRSELMCNDPQETEAVSDKEEVKHVSTDTPRNVINETSVCTIDDEKAKVTPDVRLDLQINMPDVNHKTTEELPVANTNTPDVRNDTAMEASVDDNKNESNTTYIENEKSCGMQTNQDGITLISDNQDETPLERQFVADNTDDQPKEDVQIDTPVEQMVNDDTNKETKQKFDSEDTPIDERDVNNSIKNGYLKHDRNNVTDVDTVNLSLTEETEPKLDVTSVDEMLDLDKTEDSAVQNQILENSDTNILQKNETNKKGVDESRTQKSTDLICDGTYNENTADEQQTIEAEEEKDFVCTDSTDMDISDQYLEDETQAACFELNVCGPEMEQKMEETVCLQGSEIKSPGHLSFTDHDTVKLTNGGTSLPQEIDDPSTSLSNPVHHETLSVCQTRDESNNLPPCSEIPNPEPLDMKDSSHEPFNNGSIENQVLINEMPAQEIKSCRAIKVEDGSEQIGLSSTTGKIIAVKISEKHENLDTSDKSQRAVQTPFDGNTNSRSCTPTQDELPFSQAVDDDSEYLEWQSYQQAYYSVQQSSASAWLRSDQSSSYSLDTSDAMYPGYNAQSSLQDNYWFSSKHNKPVKPADEHMTKQKPCYFDYEDIPSSQDFTFEEETTPINHFELYDTYSCGSAGLRRLRESYKVDEDLHFISSISAHKEVPHRTRRKTKMDADISKWVPKMPYTGSNDSSDGDRSFRHYADSGVVESKDIAVSPGTKSTCKSRWKQKRIYRHHKWQEEDSNDPSDFSMKNTFTSGRNETRMSRTSSPYQHKEVKQCFDWRRYFRREEIFISDDGKIGHFHDPPSSIITVLDKKGNKVIIERPSSLNWSEGTRSTMLNADYSNVDDQNTKPNITQSSMELEYLIFSEKMTHLLKHRKTSSRIKSQQKTDTHPVEHPMTIKFSRLDEQDSFVALNDTWQNFSKFKINVDMSDKRGLKKTTSFGKPLHLQSRFCEKASNVDCVKISDITKESAKSYQTMMNDICVGKTFQQKNDEVKTKRDIEGSAPSKQPGFSDRIKKDPYDNPHDNLNSVRQSCKFYVLVTSADPFFYETKDLLKAEGHTEVEPYEFNLEGKGQTPLLIVMRNEDIADHICEVPRLLELKKSPRVLFAGIDQPDDVVNLTHQELFAKGGFVVFDETTMNTLNLEHMQRIVGVMEELDKKWKWKWFLHYRDSRKLRENARCSAEALRRKQFMDCCQEAGIVDVLPYHECDVISRDRPDYLRCLVRLQIQNISARFPVFITDTPGGCFEKSGILTMDIHSFQRILSNDTCSIS